VAGTWKLNRSKARAVLEVAPFATLSKDDSSAVEAEGMALLGFAAPDAAESKVRVLPPAW
jgi:hypothetical protein